MNDVKYPELAGKFRKKPVVIDAWCIDYNNTPYPEWVESAFNKDETEAGAIDWCPSAEGLYINTLEGHMQAAVGDFLIRGVAGEMYACRADIFAATYEAAHLADATCALRGAQKESVWTAPEGWKWMTHPDWNDGKPLPALIFTDPDGELCYMPFDFMATDFEWDKRDPAWTEVSAPAPIPGEAK